MASKADIPGRGNWLRLIALLAAAFIVTPSVVPACYSQEEDLILAACLVALSDPSEACEPFLVLEVRVHSNADGSVIPDARAILSNQYSRSWTYTSYRPDGIIIIDFGAGNEAANLVPCGDWCNSRQEVFYGHTRCLEDGRTVDILVEVEGEGHTGQSDILTLDNRSRYEIMTFFLDPL